MRDIFEELFANQPLDPMEAARRGMRPNLRRRFYAEATIKHDHGGYAVLLDLQRNHKSYSAIQVGNRQEVDVDSEDAHGRPHTQ